MKEIKLGNVDFTTGPAKNSGTVIIGSFGGEGTGKTRFPITGPEVIGYVPLERKSYRTIENVAAELGKTVWRPKDPESIITNPRKANLLAVPDSKLGEKGIIDANNKLREYYRTYANRTYDAIYAMLEHPDVRTVVIDTFTQFTSIIDSAIYGFITKYIKIESKTYQDRREFNQEVIDFLNSLPTYGKNVVLIHRHKDEYGKSGPTGRKTWEGFKFLGNYTNILVHHESNPKWDPDNDDENRRWHFSLSIRTCQNASHLEGPDGYRFLKDDDITFLNLISTIDPEADPETLI